MEITNTEVYGFEAALRGMRNPKNSWDKIDSIKIDNFNPTREMANHKFKKEGYNKYNCEGFLIGDNDLKLAQTLIKSGSEHMKFMRQIQVWADFDMTRFFWSEMDTYHFNSKNSCSTMHKLLDPKREITKDMFDYNLEDEDIVDILVNRLNKIRGQFLATKDFNKQTKLKRRAKCLLMEGFLQTRTMNTNYAEIRNIVLQRKHHQMKEDWQETFCAWATTLPYAKELIFCGIEDDYERLKEMYKNA